MISTFSTRVTAAILVALIVTGGFVGFLLFRNMTANQTTLPNADVIFVPTKTFSNYVNYEKNYTINALQYSPEMNLTNVVNLDEFLSLGLTDDAIHYLQEHYFFADSNSMYDQFYKVYEENYYSEIPSFVSVDSVLHAYHTIYDIAMRIIEEQRFLHMINMISQHMVEVSLNQYHQLTNEPWKTAALKNAALFSAAARIANSTWQIPDEVSDWVETLLSLITSANGPSRNWFMGQNLDFSQFKPRGHYTRSETLKRYFKVMMLFGQVSFRLHPSSYKAILEKNNNLGRNETAQAILLTLALSAQSSVFPVRNGANRTWSQVYDTTSFFVGRSDDLSPYEYHWLIDTLYHGEIHDALDAQNKISLDVFISNAEICRDPRILGSMYTAQANSSFGNATKGMRFMGQRFVPDSYIMSELVFDRISNKTLPRVFPKGLDVMAALGSECAWNLLENETIYENYESRMMGLKEEFSNLSTDTWTQNLYWLWLYSLKPLLDTVPAGCPSFMQDPGWQYKQLVTSLGSWTELRHDSILYAKQSHSSGFTSMPHPPPGYVEPIPATYARLASLCAMMIGGLQSRGLLYPELNLTLSTLHNLLLDLRDISIKELQNDPYDEYDLNILRNIGLVLSSIEELNGTGSDATLVVDVHTDPNTERVLEEATGHPMVLYVIVPTHDGQLFLARGAMYSYYEFTMPLSERLTDEEWREMINSEDRPQMPAWTSSFVAAFIGTGSSLVSVFETSIYNLNMSVTQSYSPVTIVQSPLGRK